MGLLEGGDSDDSGDGEDEDGEWDDEGDWDDYEEVGERLPSSMPMEGDLAAGSEMAPLPVPNYSAEELLMEEQGRRSSGNNNGRRLSREGQEVPGDERCSNRIADRHVGLRGLRAGAGGC